MSNLFLDGSKTGDEDTGAKKVPVSSIDMGDILERFKRTLQKEAFRLEAASGVKGGLTKDDSSALVNYIKVVHTLIKDENAILGAMTDDELKKVLKE